MEDHVAASCRSRQRIGVEHAPFHELDVTFERLDPATQASREVVDHADCVPALEQSSNKVVADEAGTPGYERPHISAPNGRPRGRGKVDRGGVEEVRCAAVREANGAVGRPSRRLDTRQS